MLSLITFKRTAFTCENLYSLGVVLSLITFKHAISPVVQCGRLGVVLSSIQLNFHEKASITIDAFFHAFFKK